MENVCWRSSVHTYAYLFTYFKCLLIEKSHFITFEDVLINIHDSLYIVKKYKDKHFDGMQFTKLGCTNLIFHLIKIFR